MDGAGVHFTDGHSYKLFIMFLISRCHGLVASDRVLIVLVGSNLCKFSNRGQLTKLELRKKISLATTISVGYVL